MTTVSAFTESVVEEAALAWLEGLGYTVLSGPSISAGEIAAERIEADYSDVILERRVRQTLQRLNPNLPPEALDDAFRRLTHDNETSLIANNHAFHQILVNGVTVEYNRADGSIGGALVRVIDFEAAENNDWLAVNQFTIVEGQYTRRPDVLIFINGLPIALLELKNAADENATIWTAFKQIQTYKSQIPSLFAYNELLVISDGMEARVGSLTADTERFMPWRTIGGEELAPTSLPQLQVLIEGLFERRRLLDFIRHFVVFEDEGRGVLIKKIAGYHQFHAVNRALRETLSASAEGGDRRVGVVWHTQGSGKSLTMAFYAGRLVLEPTLQNPTIVVITDRNDLDDQLYGTFSRCHELLRQAPLQALDREHLRSLVQVSSGGVIFTTIQKFMPAEGDKYPQLTDRRNVIVVADEAHRSQYDFIDGFARHMRDALPHASFIGFTGTPIEKTDVNTRSVFGDYISIYDIQRAVEDGATVPIYYESRLAKLELPASEKPKVDTAFEEATEGEEVDRKEKLRTKWAAVEAVVGTEKRLNTVAKDLVKHFEERLEVMDGKAMIVCMSRRICVDLYNEIMKLRPTWHSENDDAGVLKIVMTGSATDGPEWQQHIRDKRRREALGKRFKNAKDPFKIVIVRDMWLTGFDVPSLHTMYADKPMRAHGLMQAIARVNRVFKDKPGGLVVDYLGIAHELKLALATYTESGGKGQTALPQEEAVARMIEKYEICRGLFHGFDWSMWLTGTSAQKLAILPNAQEHVLKQEDGKNRLLKAVSDLSKAFALAVPHDAALKIRDDVGFFQAIRSVLAKTASQQYRPEQELDNAIRQIISRAMSSGEVVDIFAAAGLKKPDISILSEEFLREVSNIPQKNLAVELLRKLLNDEIKSRSRRNVVKGKLFSAMLESSIHKYQNRAIQAAQVIEELIGLAKEMREESAKGEELGLSEDEVAFYDALEVNDSAVKVLGEPTLKTIARELVDTVRRNTTIDWAVRENIRANLRVLVKRILRKYGYPPDKQEKATLTVLEQAEALSANWAVTT
ncbi:type I site-specific deoxyribonuclease, HsdR family [Candidatus Koribacter versatilis Ellin345]|uniref:Type I restriction enzyme endonuclease subunit n=1 Tax=Koribacter versatilis (strain Ellin345) TaxID=204669 RepID=Q1IK45_KORVE|nr:type I restriction endonuclease subunit R [Candidatus Koribacter versatilis]ABF42755.1 type I site-specific deoxyribonuclease, HsdR family [Candidatus Koribacter versatilis Ellin345]